MEEIAVADASVFLLTGAHDEILLANDRGLIEAARTHGVECRWVTTLLFKWTKEGDVSGEDVTDYLT